MENQWAYKRNFLQENGWVSCTYVTKTSHSGMSFRQINRSERDSLLRSKPYCLYTCEWGWGGVDKFWKFQDLRATWELSLGYPSRKNCFRSDGIAFQQFPARSIRTLSCSVAVFFSSVISCVASDGMRKKHRNADTDRAWIMGLAGSSSALSTLHYCFSIQVAFVSALSFWNCKMTMCEVRRGYNV